MGGGWYKNKGPSSPFNVRNCCVEPNNESHGTGGPGSDLEP